MPLPRPPRSKAFSLTELLLVVCLVCMMAAGSLPLVRTLFDAHRLSAATARLSDLVNQSRTAAASRQLYVWLALRQEGKDGVWAAAVSTGKTSSYEDGDLIAITPPVYLEGVSLSDGENPRGLRFQGAAPESEGVAPLSSSEGGGFSTLPPLRVGGKTVEFNRFILFTPSGEAQVSNESLSRWIQVGVSLSGRASGGTGDRALLQISGLASQCIVYRP
ncbi:MAG TPA: hypothetical protein VIM58_12645 [Candidatus Methylacidiphilales bacterium]